MNYIHTRSTCQVRDFQLLLKQITLLFPLPKRSFLLQQRLAHGSIYLLEPNSGIILGAWWQSPTKILSDQATHKVPICPCECRRTPNHDYLSWYPTVLLDSDRNKCLLWILHCAQGYRGTGSAKMALCARQNNTPKDMTAQKPWVSCCMQRGIKGQDGINVPAQLTLK
jgi:hypothetical protein